MLDTLWSETGKKTIEKWKTEITETAKGETETTGNSQSQLNSVMSTVNYL